MALTYIAIVLSVVGSTWCWWHISRSVDSLLFKIVLALIAAIPFVGPFMYLFADMPVYHSRKKARLRHMTEKQSRFMKHWDKHEHVYLGWASFVFWSLALLAYWMNDWQPGRMIEGPFGTYNEVDVLFFSLLIGAVLTFGAAIRAKLFIHRELRLASKLL